MQTRNKLSQEEAAYKNFQNLAQTYKTENITNGLSDSARVKIEINSLTFTRLNKRYSNIYIKIIYGKLEKITEIKPDARNLVWNEIIDL
jgi:type II secretory pathway pseudopilin PulG